MNNRGKKQNKIMIDMMACLEIIRDAQIYLPIIILFTETELLANRAVTNIYPFCVTNLGTFMVTFLIG